MASSSARAKTGADGQRRAQLFLEGKGYRFVESNWRCRIGEIDLIMIDPSCNELVFIEVKTRHDEQLGHAMNSISKRQTRNLLNSGQWFVTNHPDFHNHIWRIDIVAITIVRNGPPAIEHEINAVYLDA